MNFYLKVFFYHLEEQLCIVINCTKVLCIVLDTRLSFETYIRSIATSTSSNLGIMRKALSLFGDPVLVLGFEVFLEFPASCVRVLLTCLDV